jgi:hypothetical protein
MPVIAGESHAARKRTFCFDWGRDALLGDGEIADGWHGAAIDIPHFGLPKSFIIPIIGPDTRQKARMGGSPPFSVIPSTNFSLRRDS